MAGQAVRKGGAKKASDTAAKERLRKIAAIRKDPLKWFQGFGYWMDEQSRKATRGPANILQKRVFEHIRRCQEANEPCRIVTLKYRRAGSSTCGNAGIHTAAMNHNARLGVIGTDYKASSNMLDMVQHFAKHDDFPGWCARVTAGDEIKVKPEDWYENLDVIPLEERVEKTIATKIKYAHGSLVELYTSKNPESARSAGLNGYLATEVGRWATGGEQDAGETLTAMRNALPKKGFHVAIEESTANGAQGAFYETCRKAKWPGYADWWKQWGAIWPLEAEEFGEELQFTFIFAAWFEDERHVPAKPLTAEQIERLQTTLDDRERALIERYSQDGPRGQRLGGEVNATVWDQLAWRRAIIKTVCTTNGADEFDQEYPSDPRVAFKSSGSPALNQDGILALEEMCRGVIPEYGQLSPQRNREQSLRGILPWELSFDRCDKEQATIEVWEQPMEGLAYVISVDCMSGAEQVTGTGIKDRNSVPVLRAAYRDTHGNYHEPRVAARIKAPCEWDEKPLARYVHLLATYYGGAMVVPEVEGGCGTALAMDLLEYGTHIYQRSEFDNVSQKTTLKLGWRTTSVTRPVAISTLQHYVREQLVRVECPHIVGELGSLVINTKGKAEASSGRHDDDAMALAIGLSCLDQARVYPSRPAVRRRAPDEDRWRGRAI